MLFRSYSTSYLLSERRVTIRDSLNTRCRIWRNGDIMATGLRMAMDMPMEMGDSRLDIFKNLYMT